MSIMRPSSMPELSKVKILEAAIKRSTQVQIPIVHRLHAGMYHRTAILPAGVIMTNVLIKIPTLVIISGHCKIGLMDYEGYHVLDASANRKQGFWAIKETHITMVFPTSAATVEQAEEEFTDEANSLQSRSNINTGNKSCQEHYLLLQSQP